MQEVPIIIHLPGKSEKTLEASLRVPDEGSPRFIVDELFGGLHRYESIGVVYAQSKYGNMRYSFVDCYFLRSSNQRTEYGINELYYREWISESLADQFASVTFSISHLTRFIDQNRIHGSEDIVDTRSLNIEPAFTVQTAFGDGLTLELQQYTSVEYKPGAVNISDVSCFRIIAVDQASRWLLFDKGVAAIRLFSLFTGIMPEFHKAIFFKKDKSRVELTLGIKTPPEERPFLPLTYRDLTGQWEDIVRRFILGEQPLVKIIDLLDESLTNNTSEVSFLNATTALEQLHKHFYKSVSTEVFQDIREALRETIGKIYGDMRQIYRYYHLLQNLPPIVALQKRIDDPKQFCKQLTDSRNHYTHYGETKGEIWTVNELHWVNNLLQQLIRAILLKGLGLTAEQITTIVDQQLSFFHHSYEKNKYSVRYLPQSDDDI